MSLYQAAYFLVALVFLVLITARGRVEPFIALVLAAIGFGYAAGMSTSSAAKAFGLGFGQTLTSLGLIVVAGALLAEIADSSGATAWLQRKASGWRSRSPLLAAIGLVSGVASTPAGAFAVLGPLRRGLGDSPRSALVLGLSLSASHGLLIPAPVMLASLTILRGDWMSAVLFGLPLAILLVVLAIPFARFTASDTPRPVDTVESIDGESLHAPGRGALALVLVSAVLVGLLATQSLGDIASEPLGGGSNREFLIALGRPLTLLVAGTVLLLALSWHWERGGLSQTGWAGRALIKVAPLLLLVGAAGGLQKMAQETGMAEMNAERLLDCAPVGALALLLPFALAAIVKTLQGSSLVAAITASGMMMELVGPLGLDDPAGRTLAALAVGAGAMSVSHINDGFFWLVTRAGAFSPGAALARLSLGTALQGALTVLLLIVFRLLAA